MLEGILRNTPAYQYIAEEAREEERERQLRARLQAQRKLLLTLVEVHFPTLINVAKTQARLIKDVTVIEAVVAGVIRAKTSEEAQHHLLVWKQDQQHTLSKKKKGIK